MLANNIYRVMHRAADDDHIARTARLLVPLVALVAVWFTLQGGETIVALLLMGYAFVTQLFPALLMSLARRNPVTRAGAFAGICVGVATVAAITLTHTTLGTLFPNWPEAVKDINVGIVALVLNVVALIVVSGIEHALSGRASPVAESPSGTGSGNRAAR